MPESVSNKVEALRRQRGATQEELAKAVGVTRQTVIAIEKGHYTPSVRLALKISRFFKTPLEKIFKLTK